MFNELIYILDTMEDPASGEAYIKAYAEKAVPYSKLDIQPDEYFRIRQIILPGIYTTEKAYDFGVMGAFRRWQKLAFGINAPEWIPDNQAVLFAEAFWINWLREVTCGNWTQILLRFVDSMLNDVPFYGWIAGVDGPIENPTWDQVAKMAYEAGVDCQIRSWAAGVPLEHIIPVRISD